MIGLNQTFADLCVCAHALSIQHYNMVVSCGRTPSIQNEVNYCWRALLWALCLLAHAQSITLRHGLGLRHAFDVEKLMCIELLKYWVFSIITPHPLRVSSKRPRKLVPWKLVHPESWLPKCAQKAGCLNVPIKLYDPQSWPEKKLSPTRVPQSWYPRKLVCPERWLEKNLVQHGYSVVESWVRMLGDPQSWPKKPARISGRTMDVSPPESWVLKAGCVPTPTPPINKKKKPKKMGVGVFVAPRKLEVPVS